MGWQKNKIKENEIECKQKQEIINELKQQNIQIDNDREAAEIWLKIKEFQTKNDVKKKEFADIMKQSQLQKKEMNELKKKYDEKEKVLRTTKNKKKQEILKKIDLALNELQSIAASKE